MVGWTSLVDHNSYPVPQIINEIDFRTLTRTLQDIYIFVLEPVPSGFVLCTWKVHFHPNFKKIADWLFVATPPFTGQCYAKLLIWLTGSPSCHSQPLNSVALCGFTHQSSCLSFKWQPFCDSPWEVWCSSHFLIFDPVVLTGVSQNGILFVPKPFT